MQIQISSKAASLFSNHETLDVNILCELLTLLFFFSFFSLNSEIDNTNGNQGILLVLI